MQLLEKDFANNLHSLKGPHSKMRDYKYLELRPILYRAGEFASNLKPAFALLSNKPSNSVYTNKVHIKTWVPYLRYPHKSCLFFCATVSNSLQQLQIKKQT